MLIMVMVCFLCVQARVHNNAQIGLSYQQKLREGKSSHNYNIYVRYHFCRKILGMASLI